MTHSPDFPPEAFEAWRQLLDALPSGTALLDLEGGLLHANAAWAGLWERGNGELPGKPLQEWLPEVSISRLQGDLERVRAGESLSTGLCPRGAKEGDGPMNARLAPCRQGGRVVGCFAALETGPGAAGAQPSAEALRESHELFTRIFELSPEGMALNRLSDGAFIAVNAAFEATFGWLREEVLGRTAREVEIWDDPDYRDALAQELIQKGIHTSVEACLRRKDGTLIPALVSVCVLDVQGEPCVLTLGRDITAHRRDEEILRQTQKLESLGVLAGGIAHDFNNLFQALLANLNLAQEETAEGTSTGRLDSMERILRRAQALSRQMLIYAGRGALSREVFDLTRLIEEIPELLRVSVPKKASLRLELAGQKAMLFGDPSQIQQVVLNLVVNAAEALIEEEGHIHLSSWIESLEGPFGRGAYILEPVVKGPHLVLEVQDDGRGMDPATLGKIFDPFFSTKSPGRGLGLSAILGILRAHRAGIQVWSTPGTGTRFRVAFPLSSEGETFPPPDPMKAPSPRQADSQGRILFADDEPEVRETTAALLESLGYRVDRAVDGLEAVQVFCREPHAYDLVLLDATMPRMSGPEALEGMLSLRPGLPAVLCTGYSADADQETHLSTGFARVLQKPFTRQELEAALAQARGQGP